MHPLLARLLACGALSVADWLTLLRNRTQALMDEAQELACARTLEHFGHKIYIRGIVECTNYCNNNCFYCGLQRTNRDLTRYRLEHDQILAACATGYRAGIRTFVFQGGEDKEVHDTWLTALITRCKEAFPDCAITLSFGERSTQSYAALFHAGADRYLLRHETASPRLYRRLHPGTQRFWHRISCCYALRAIGFQTGCGMMVGVPGQDLADLAEDMAFLQDFHPAMIGIGPFLPHHATPFRAHPAGDVKLTLYLISLCRILHPRVLLPATTALRNLHPEGLRAGVQAGANVVMPSLTPRAEKAHYTLYDTTQHAKSLAQTLDEYARALAPLGREICVDRGDYAQQPQDTP